MAWLHILAQRHTVMAYWDDWVERSNDISHTNQEPDFKKDPIANYKKDSFFFINLSDIIVACTWYLHICFF